MTHRSRAGNAPHKKTIAAYAVKNIAAAVENGWIKAYYQPVIRSLTGEVCGVEALARWDDPEYGLLEPQAFIGPLEENGLIHLLDCYMLEQVCQALKNALSQGLPAVPVSVNLSRNDFVLCDIFRIVEDTVKKWGIPKEYIHIEITESMIAREEALMRKAIGDFRRAGYEIWMDDFGSGYSSLNMLKDYPFDLLKIDMRFLSSMSERSRAIMRATIGMAKDIGTKTLAEGVETPEQAEFLKDEGCGRLQGFLYGQPMTAGDYYQGVAERSLTIEDQRRRLYYDAASLAARAVDVPLEILEDDGVRFRTLFMNRIYMDQIFDDAPSLEEADRRIYHTASPLLKKYRQYADQIRASGEEETFYYTTDTSHLCFKGQKIAEQDGRMLMRASIINLSRDAFTQKRNSLSDGLKEINHLFEAVERFSLEKGRIEPLLGKMENVPAARGGIAQAFGEYAEAFVFPADRARYRVFTDPASIRERIEKDGKGYVEDLFRLRQRGGGYRWQAVSVLMIPGTGGNEYLLCRKTIPAGAEAVLDKAFRERDAARQPEREAAADVPREAIR